MVNTIRLLARSLAIVLAALLVMYAVEKGYDPRTVVLQDMLLATPFLISWFGMLAGWRWEAVGGLLNMFGVAAYYAAQIWISDTIPQGWLFPLLALPGFLYLLCFTLKR
jgi:hypothetical protein